MFRILLARLLLPLGLALFLPAAAAFTLVDTQGKTHRLSEYQGKWVLVNFWATWCPPCLEEIPDLAALHANPRNNLVVLGVALDYRDTAEIERFVQRLKINYPIILGDYKMAEQVGPVRGLPTTYLFNPQGKVVAYNVGALTRAAVESYIRDRKPQGGPSR